MIEPGGKAWLFNFHSLQIEQVDVINVERDGSLDMHFVQFELPDSLQGVLTNNSWNADWLGETPEEVGRRHAVSEYRDCVEKMLGFAACANENTPLSE